MRPFFAVMLVSLAVTAMACAPAAQPSPTAPAPREPAKPAASPVAKAAEPAAKPGRSEEVERLIAAAKAAGETELDVSWQQSIFGLGGAEGNKKFETLFNRMYDTNVKLNYTPGPGYTDSAARVSQEIAAGQKPFTDLMLGADSTFVPLLSRNVVEEYDYTKLSPRITKDMVSARNIVVEISGRVPGITYNSNSVSAAEAPKKLEDVLNPKWKGKIATPPGANGLDDAAVRPEWGPDKMNAFVIRLSDQVGGLIRVGELNRVASGEFLMLVLDSGGHDARRLKAQGAPVDHSIAEDAATEAFTYLGVPRNSAHPNLAKLYINMVMSEEGQKIVYEITYTDHHNMPGSQSAAFLTELKARGVKLTRRDVAEERPEQAALRKEFENILREKQGG